MKSPALRIGSLPPIQVSGGTLITVLVLAVIIHPSLMLGSTGPGAAALLALGIAVFMIISVLVHELAHAVAARAFGASVDHIALTLWGGHTQYRGGSTGAPAGVVIALAGPLSNGLLAAACWGLGALVAPAGSAAVFWSFSALLNIALALFNLLPGLPMDGGRALESLLGAVLRNRALGTRITAWIGRGIAVAVLVVAVTRAVLTPAAGTGALLIVLWAVLIAGLLWQGASRALRDAAVQGRVELLDAAQLARPMRILGPDHPLGDLPAEADLGRVLILEAPHRPGPGAQGAPADPGVVGRAFRIHPAAARAVPLPQRASTPVSAVAGPVGEVGVLGAGLRGDALVSAMLSRPHPAYLVEESDGTLRGVILSAEVDALLRGR